MKIELALELLLALIGKAEKITQAINAARAAGRDDLTDEEVESFVRADDEARTRLEEAITRRNG